MSSRQTQRTEERPWFARYLRKAPIPAGVTWGSWVHPEILLNTLAFMTSPDFLGEPAEAGESSIAAQREHHFK